MTAESCTAEADLDDTVLELRSAREQCEPMLRLFKLPGAMVELAVGTVIVIVHLGLAGAKSQRTLPARDTSRLPN